MSTKEIGNWGEKIAENYLRNKGYQILEKNYSFRISGPQKGEIDIITKKDGTVVFIEVKTLYQKILRPQDFLMEEILPEEKVDYLKQRKLIKAANSWLMRNKMPFDTKWQIDVMAIEIDSQNKKAKIRHLKNAIIS